MKKILIIGTDRGVFDKRSTVRHRVTRYADSVDELHDVVFSRRNHLLPERDTEGRAVFYSTNSVSRLNCLIDALMIGRKIICRSGSVENWSISCQDPFETGLVGVCLSRYFSIDLELQVHTDIGSPYFQRSFSNKLRFIICRYTIPRATYIRVVSHRIKNYLIESLGVDADKIEVRPIVVDVQTLRLRQMGVDLHVKYPMFKKIVLMASRLEKEKDIAFALKIWKKVSVEIVGAGLLIVGSGSQDAALKKLTYFYGIENSVIFEPWADDLSSYYRSADVFLLTSLYEGYGMTLVEANALGCPIVSSDVGIAGSLSKCLTCPVGDELCFIEALNKYLAS